MVEVGVLGLTSHPFTAALLPCIVTAIIAVLVVVTASFLICCKTKQRKLDITETGDPIIVSRDPSICHHKNVESIVATRTQDEVDVFVGEEESEKSNQVRHHLTKPADLTYNDIVEWRDESHDVTDERIYEDINDLDLDHRLPQPIPGGSQHALNDEHSLFIYESLDQYIDVNFSHLGVDNPGFSATTVDALDVHYFSTQSLNVTGDTGDSKISEDINLYDLPGWLEERGSKMDKVRGDPRVQLSDPIMIRRGSCQMSIVELERLKTERREQMYLEERKLLDKINNGSLSNIHEANTSSKHRDRTVSINNNGDIITEMETKTMRVDNTQNKPTQSAIGGIQKQSINEQIANSNKILTSNKSYPAIQIDSSLNNKRVVKGNQKTQFKYQNDSPNKVMSPQVETNSDRKSSLTKKGSSNDIKSNRGSVRFKQGFDIIPDAVFVEKESIVARNIRLATERDQEIAVLDKLNKINQNANDQLGTKSPTAFDGQILKSQNIISNDQGVDKTSVVAKESGLNASLPLSTIDGKLQTRINKTVIRSVDTKSQPRSPITKDTYINTKIAKHFPDVSKSRGSSFANNGKVVQESPTGRGGITAIKKPQQKVNARNSNEKITTTAANAKDNIGGNPIPKKDSAIKTSHTVKVKMSVRPKINFSQTIGVQSGRVIMEKELQEMKIREIEFSALKGTS